MMLFFCDDFNTVHGSQCIFKTFYLKKVRKNTYIINFYIHFGVWAFVLIFKMIYCYRTGSNPLMLVRKIDFNEQ